MAKRVSTVVLALLLALPAIAAALDVQTWDVTFTWDANTESDLAGYRLYTVSGELVKEMTASEVQTVLEDVGPGEHSWYLTAFDFAGNESGPSNIVSTTLVDDIPPADPGGLQISVTVNVNVTVP